MKKHIIDCDANPFIPGGWEVVEHQKGGRIKWDATKVALYLDEGQKGSKRLVGNDLRQKLTQQPVLNANVLDYLLAHPDLIPEEWKGKVVFFWGTIYRSSDGSLCVRCLDWDGGGWSWYDGGWLDDEWNVNDPAAVLASALTSTVSSTVSLSSLDERLKVVEEYIAKLKSI